MKDEHEIRLECLKFAAGRGVVDSAIIARAKEYEHYVMTGDAQRVPADRGERPAAKPAKEASTVPEKSGDASDQSHSKTNAGSDPPKRASRSKK